MFDLTTKTQMAALARAFADWNSLPDKLYGSVPDGPDISVRYGTKTIRGGSEMPRQVMDILTTINKTAASMPRVDPPP